MRSVGCGRRFSAALTWAGHVYTWGALGTTRSSAPVTCNRLLGRAVVVSLACGQDHLTMVTGDPGELASSRDAHAVSLARARDVASEARGEIRGRLAKEKQQQAADAAEMRKKAQAEKRRVKLLARLTKQRAALKKRLAGRAVVEAKEKIDVTGKMGGKKDDTPKD